MKRHNYKLGYTVTRLALQGAGLVRQAEAARRHPPQEARAPAVARHAAVPGRLDPSLDRRARPRSRPRSSRSTMRRARSTRPSWSRRKAPRRAFSGSSRRSPRTACSAPSIPIAARTTSTRRRPAARSTRSKPTQVGRALAQLGITHIPSYSPEARGRMERVFGTLQSRLPPELRLAEITTVEAANRYLQGAVRARLQRPLRGAGGRAGLGVHPLCRPAARGRPVHPGGAARSGATTASTGTGSPCRSRRSAIAITTSGPPCGCTNIPTAGSPSSTARAASRGSTRTESRSMSRAPLNSARRAPAWWICGQRCALPTTPQAQQQQQRTFDVL